MKHRGQIFTLDVVIGTALFLVSLISVLYVWDIANSSIQEQERYYEMESLVHSAVEQLVRTPGYPHNWTRSNVQVYGLVETTELFGSLKSEDRILDPDKTLEFIWLIKNRNDEIKNQLIGVGRYNLYAEVSCLNESQTSCFNGLPLDEVRYDVACSNDFAFTIDLGNGMTDSHNWIEAEVDFGSNNSEYCYKGGCSAGGMSEIGDTIEHSSVVKTFEGLNNIWVRLYDDDRQFRIKVDDEVTVVVSTNNHTVKWIKAGLFDLNEQTKIWVNGSNKMVDVVFITSNLGYNPNSKNPPYGNPRMDTKCIVGDIEGSKGVIVQAQRTATFPRRDAALGYGQNESVRIKVVLWTEGVPEPTTTTSTTVPTIDIGCYVPVPELYEFCSEFRGIKAITEVKVLTAPLVCGQDNEVDVTWRGQHNQDLNYWGFYLNKTPGDFMFLDSCATEATDTSETKYIMHCTIDMPVLTLLSGTYTLTVTGEDGAPDEGGYCPPYSAGMDAMESIDVQVTGCNEYEELTCSQKTPSSPESLCSSEEIYTLDVIAPDSIACKQDMDFNVIWSGHHGVDAKTHFGFFLDEIKQSKTLGNCRTEKIDTEEEHYYQMTCSVYIPYMAAGSHNLLVTANDEYGYCSSPLNINAVDSINIEKCCHSGMDGTGSTGNPCIITTCKQLQNIEQDLTMNYALGQDIDCSGFDFTPISTFGKTLEGRGFKIKDLTIDQSGIENVGLFKSMTASGIISDLGMERVDVTGNSYVGALVGENRGLIRRSYVTGSVDGGISNIGALVGYNWGTISSSYSIVEMTGMHQIGGLAGYNRGFIEYSYSLSDVTASGTNVGGLVGHNGNTGNTIESYAIGNVAGGEAVGGLVGKNSPNSHIIGCFYNVHAGNPGLCIGSAGGATNECTPIDDSEPYFYDASNLPMSGWSYPPWDDSEVCSLCGHLPLAWENAASCSMCPGFVSPCPGDMDGAGIGSEPCLVTSCTQLQSIEEALTLDYALAGDISCEGFDYGDLKGFKPIGISTNRFSGSLDGRGNSITGLFINRPAGDQGCGLFGVIDSAVEIRNLSLEDVDVTGKNQVGSLFGVSAGAVTIDSIRVTGRVETADANIGGIAGALSGGGVLRNSYFIGTVEGGSFTSGGLVGTLAGENSRIENSYAIADVNGGNIAGGLLGRGITGTLSITNSFAVGNVSGTLVGGVVGQLVSGSIQDVYWNRVSEGPTECYFGGDAGCTMLDDNEIYFYYLNNMPMSLWSYPPWSNSCDGCGYPRLEFEGIGECSLCGSQEPGMMFYASYDSSLDADESRGNPAHSGSGASIQTVGGRTGVLVSTGDSLTYETEGNIRQSAGTIDFWVRPNQKVESYGSYERIFDAPLNEVAPWDYTNTLFNIFWDKDDKMPKVQVRNGSVEGEVWLGCDTSLEGTCNWDAGTWHRMTVTWDNNIPELKFYADGVLEASTNRYMPALSDTMYVGLDNWASKQSDSTIDEFKIYDKALSAGDIEIDIEDIPALSAYYPLDGDMNDATGNGYDGSCVGANCPAYTSDGLLGGAYDFDGANDYISLDYDVFRKSQNDQFSISAWFNGDDYSSAGWKSIFGIGGACGADNTRFVYLLGIEPTMSEASFTTGKHCSSNNPSRPVYGVDEGEWYHAVVVYDNKNMKLYVDGIERDTATFTLSSGTSSALIASIGNNLGDVNSRGFDGKIDEVRFYSKALTMEEIELLQGGVNLFQTRPIVVYNGETGEKLTFEGIDPVKYTVEYGLTEGYGDQVTDLTYKRVHEVSLSSLGPGTKYYYRVTVTNEVGSSASEKGSFTTSDSSDTSFSFVVIGDNRPDTGVEQPSVFSTLLADSFSKDPLFYLSTGDVVQLSEVGVVSEDDARLYWEGYTNVTRDYLKQVPFYHTPGNHDETDQFNGLKRWREIWSYPSNGDGISSLIDCPDGGDCDKEVIYWWEYGNSLFISLNSEEPSIPEEIFANQLFWLDATLQKPGYEHKFVYVHRPIKGSDRTSYTLEDQLDQMFADNDVTAVFQGHDHHWCDYVSTRNVLYVTTGGGGAPLYSDYCEGNIIVEHHYTYVEVNGDTVNVVMIDDSGTERKRLTLPLGGTRTINFNYFIPDYPSKDTDWAELHTDITGTLEDTTVDNPPVGFGELIGHTESVSDVPVGACTEWNVLLHFDDSSTEYLYPSNQPCL